MGNLGSERSDCITPVIRNIETEKVSITRKELNTNCLAIVIAGCQLTTVALATSVYLLCRYPETLKQLAQEVRSAFEKEADITVASMQNLPYLMAVINKTLRIHHPTPINLPRNVLPQGQMVSGKFVPGAGGVSFISFSHPNYSLSHSYSFSHSLFLHSVIIFPKHPKPPMLSHLPFPSERHGRQPPKPPKLP